jgi:uncharacterized protein (DUF58 family)
LAQAAAKPDAYGRLIKPEVLATLANLELVARTVVDGALVGMHRSPFFGFSQEFAEYKMYVEGDDPRYIDWNVYARSDRTYIKRFLGETNSHLMLLIDASASMGFGSGKVNKFLYAKMLAASLAYLSTHQHDAVGTLIFDEEIREFRPPSSRSGQFHAILHSLDAAQPARRTNIKHPFERFPEHVSRRGLVAVISDFYCDPDEMLKAVRPLAYQGQDVVLMQVLDPFELNPTVTSSTLFEDMETGEAIEVSPDFMQREYPEKVKAHIAGLRTAAIRAGADHMVFDTSAPLDEPLRQYLMFRQKRR